VEMMLRYALTMKPALPIALVLVLGGCCSDPWSAYPEKTPPDRSCTTGSGVQGTDVYIWDCLGGQKVVVTQYSAEMTCQSPKREKVACGAKTAIEDDPTINCKGARPGRDWVPR
jgi:hypothetical protein